MSEQIEGRLGLALQAIAAELEAVQSWSRISRSMGQKRIVSVFGSARTQRGQPSYEMARSLGAALAERGWAAVTGGGPGIMQAVRDGNGDALSRAVRIEIAGEEPDSVLDPSRSITVSTFAIRKLLLTHDIDALFVFPGGVGTFDELFEVLVHQDTDRLGWFPVILMQPEGVRLWDAWMRFMDEHLVRPGLVNASVMSHIAIADSVEAAFAIADAASPQKVGTTDAATTSTEGAAGHTDAREALKI
ncbi:LOG family protein [Micromonospora deserti]|uniref:Cytokinin riboside 5'-monophosphate phosphoribohydrolase n=1 Tax=Micromonospora deserti TaxID=2070366 RepID=A0A2W2CQS8_9ACTN|nr:LOG family protein [Micromonospora deserti]PZG01826.1 hypothetical protein C1I99_05215 [Micromonospora deserti]